MVTAPVPGNEGARLEFLRAHVSVDTRRDIALDRIVFMAAQIFRVPTAAVTLIDDERVWIKAQVGLALTHHPRRHSFCAHAILSDAVLIVGDALEDARFAGSDLVRRHPNIRFYAGAPLIAATGLRLGSVCVLDYMPRQIDPAQVGSLRRLARSATALLLEEGLGRADPAGKRPPGTVRPRGAVADAGRGGLTPNLPGA